MVYKKTVALLIQISQQECFEKLKSHTNPKYSKDMAEIKSHSLIASSFRALLTV